MSRYDHRKKAANAGDVCKHMVLCSVMGGLLALPNHPSVYAESHAGYPLYHLGGNGAWRDGIGRCLALLGVLAGLSFFHLFEEQNPGMRPPLTYWGSAGWVRLLALRMGRNLPMCLWDVCPEPVSAWRRLKLEGVTARCADGYTGAASLMKETSGGVVLIDPPYLEADSDKEAIGEAFCLAQERNWVAICWSPILDDGPLLAMPWGLVVDLPFRGTVLSDPHLQGVRIIASGLTSSLEEEVMKQVGIFLEAINSCRSSPPASP